MTTSDHAEFKLIPAREGDDAFVDLAARIGRECAPRAARYDRENRFTFEDYALLKETGYTGLAVPVELGGLGASLRQVCYAQAELARYCASTALSIAMHLHNSLTQAFRWRHGIPSAERILRRIAADGAIVMTSGGSDGIWPSGVAEKVDGGYRVSGHKVFCSQAPAADVMTTMARYEDPDEGPLVLFMAVPTTSDGFEIIETWDTLGMRGTSSHDVRLTDVAVGEEQVIARRPWGRTDPVLRTIMRHFTPTLAVVYWGIAAGARDEAVRVVRDRKDREGELLSANPLIQRQVGLMDAKLRTSWWAIVGALGELDEDTIPDDPTISALQIAKREIVNQAIEIVDIAMDTVGGASYFKRSPLEQAYRDVRAGKYHPLTPERTLLHAGRVALDLPADTIW